MSRKRLTNETLESVSRVASAREYARLAESILGPAATDREVLETAQRLSSMSLDQVRGINNRRSAIQDQTKRLGSIDGVVAGGVDGAEDPWGEAGPEQPDPTNNQAYTKEIWTTPDHAVLESLQKRDVHAPTASRASKLSRQSRQKWGAQENDEDDETDDESESDVEAGMDEDVTAGEGGPVDNEHELGDVQGAGDLDLELDEDEHEHHPGVEGEFDDHLEDLGEGEEGDDHFDDMEGDDDDDLDMEEGDGLDDLMGEDEMGDEDDDHEIFEDESGDMEDFGDEEEHEGEEMEDLGEDMEDLGDEGLHGDLGDEEEHEHALPMPPKGSRQNRASARRQASGKNPKVQKGQKKKVVASAGSTKVSLDDILNLHDEDVAREASSPLEGDDLDSLLGRKVQRAGNRVNTPAKVSSGALDSHRATFERVWDNEHESGAAPRRRQASQRPASQRKPAQQQQRRKIAQSSRDFTEDEQAFARTQFKPDRRRVASRSSDNEFDQVFKVPDVSRFFD